MAEVPSSGPAGPVAEEEPVAAREIREVGGHGWSLRRWPASSSQRAASDRLPLFVALHGFAGAGDDFAPLICGEHRLPGEWLTVDVLGHGRSAAPEPVAGVGYEMPRVAAALSELLAAVVCRPYILVGYSMGGRLALSALLGSIGGAPRPRPRGLILVGASPGIADPQRRAQRREEDEALAAKILARGIPWFADYWAQRPVLAGKRRIAARHRDAMEERLRRQRPDGLAGSLRGMGTGAMPPLWDHLGRLEVPTLLVAGAEDRKFAAIAAELRAKTGAKTRAAEMSVLAGVGHTAHLEDPSAFGAAVEAWWRRNLSS